MLNEFEIGEKVEILCKDGAAFQGELADFSSDRNYFTLRTLKGILGFPFGDVLRMDPLT